MKEDTATRMKTESLLIKLSVYDEKYRDLILNKNLPRFGYSMRAYHRLKTMSFSAEDKCKDSAKIVATELTRRGIKYHTTFLKF